jgi:hypothetical protein
MAHRNPTFLRMSASNNTSEDEKLEHRKERNRRHARETRKRKKEYVESLKTELDALRSEKVLLEGRMRDNEVSVVHIFRPSYTGFLFHTSPRQDRYLPATKVPPRIPFSFSYARINSIYAAADYAQRAARGMGSNLGRNPCAAGFCRA